MTSFAGKSILIVEDEILIAEMLAEFAEEIGLRVCGMAVSADQAVAMASAEHPSVVLMDVRLKGGIDGVVAGAAIHQAVGCPIIYVTGSAERETVVRIRQIPGASLLFKPISLDELQDLITQALDS